MKIDQLLRCGKIQPAIDLLDITELTDFEQQNILNLAIINNIDIIIQYLLKKYPDIFTLYNDDYFDSHFIYIIKHKSRFLYNIMKSKVTASSIISIIKRSVNFGNYLLNNYDELETDNQYKIILFKNTDIELTNLNNFTPIKLKNKISKILKDKIVIYENNS